MQFGRRKVDAATIGVGVFVFEAVGAGADDALQDDALFEVEFGEDGVLLRHAGDLEIAERDEFGAFEGGFEVVGKADVVGVVMVDGRSSDDADDAGGMERAAICSR